MALCDYYSDSVKPMKLVVRAVRGGFDWSQTLYIPVAGPFEPLDPYELPDPELLWIEMADVEEVLKFTW